MATISPIDVQKALKGMSYPAGKDDIVQQAQQNNADGEVLDALRKLPGREYDGPDEVSKEIGRLT
jgi:hypothetical protein